MLNSPVDIAIVAAVALLVFGPKKLPELGKALGQGIGNFKKGLQETQEEVKNAMKTEQKTSGGAGGSEAEPAAAKDA